MYRQRKLPGPLVPAQRDTAGTHYGISKAATLRVVDPNEA